MDFNLLLEIFAGLVFAGLGIFIGGVGLAGIEMEADRSSRSGIFKAVLTVILGLLLLSCALTIAVS